MSRNVSSRNVMLSIGLSLALTSGAAWAQQQDAARATEYAGAGFDAKTSADPGTAVDPAPKSISSKGVSSTQSEPSIQNRAEPASRSISEKGVSSTKSRRNDGTAVESAPESASEPGAAAAPRNNPAIEIQPASKSISEKGVSSTKSRRNE